MADTPTERDREFAREFAEKHRDAHLGEIATRRLSENERVVVWEMELAPGEASDLHHHERDYIVIVLEGDRIAASITTMLSRKCCTMYWLSSDRFFRSTPRCRASASLI